MQPPPPTPKLEVTNAVEAAAAPAIFLTARVYEVRKLQYESNFRSNIFLLLLVGLFCLEFPDEISLLLDFGSQVCVLHDSGRVLSQIKTEN